MGYTKTKINLTQPLPAILLCLKRKWISFCLFVCLNKQTSQACVLSHQNESSRNTETTHLLCLTQGLSQHTVGTESVVFCFVLFFDRMNIYHFCDWKINVNDMFNDNHGHNDLLDLGGLLSRVTQKSCGKSCCYVKNPRLDRETLQPRTILGS